MKQSWCIWVKSTGTKNQQNTTKRIYLFDLHILYVIYWMHHALVSVPWASYQIRKIAGCACAGNAGNVFPRRRFQRKPLVGDPGMHHGTCVTHVPWCMSGSLACGDGENVPGIPGACAPAILRIWQEAHDRHCSSAVVITIHFHYMISPTHCNHHFVQLMSIELPWFSYFTQYYDPGLGIIIPKFPV